MKKLLLLLLLLVPMVNAELAKDLVNKTWITSSAKNMEDSSHIFRFFGNGMFYALSDTTNGTGSIVWNGAYEIKNITTVQNLYIYSDDKSCTYRVKKISMLYEISNIYRSHTNICPTLLIKESADQLK